MDEKTASKYCSKTRSGYSLSRLKKYEHMPPWRNWQRS